MQKIRIWDLPTRLFHWILVLALPALIVTAKIGGAAMTSHLRLGYLVLALLLFRLLWGFVGGHWSRFASFWPAPARLKRYLGGSALPSEQLGHNPLGALSVLAMLLALAAQVTAGLYADDDIFFAGPLSAHVSGSVVDWATRYHTGPGPVLIIALVLLHVLAIALYEWRGQRLVGPMVHGDRIISTHDSLPHSRDQLAQRLLGLVVAALAAGLVYALLSWAG